MKNCARCGIYYPEGDFRQKKNAKCKNGFYVSGVCKHCENLAAKERDRQRRDNGDMKYILKRRQAVKRYRNTPKGQVNKKKCDTNSRQRHRDYYRKNSRKYYQQRLKRLRIEIETISDEYIITQLQNPHRKTRYTREFLKANPDIIEEARVKILNHRLKRKIEELSKFGICNGCRQKVKKSEFRIQQSTDKKNKHVIRLCEKCRKENSSRCWQKYKKKKNERHS